MMKLEDELSCKGPCFWCGYNGSNFYKTGTHEKYCPWYKIGGWEERQEKLLEVISEIWKFRKGFITPPHDVEKYYREDFGLPEKGVGHDS